MRFPSNCTRRVFFAKAKAHLCALLGSSHRGKRQWCRGQVGCNLPGPTALAEVVSADGFVSLRRFDLRRAGGRRAAVRRCSAAQIATRRPSDDLERRVIVGRRVFASSGPDGRRLFQDDDRQLAGVIVLLRQILGIHSLDAREERLGRAGHLADGLVAAAVLRKLDHQPHAVLVLVARTIRKLVADPHQLEVRRSTGSEQHPAGLPCFRSRRSP